MAAVNRPKIANYEQDGRCHAAPRDLRDHPFCGIMFSVRCRAEVSLEYLEVSSVWVRGHLGPTTVWATAGGFSGKVSDQSE